MTPQDWVFVFTVAILGLLVGSFLNVVIYRVPRKESVWYPPSRCPGCQSRLRPYENVPVASWLVLRGRCRTCHWRIPARYPLVEAITGAVYTIVALVAVLTISPPWLYVATAASCAGAAASISVLGIRFDQEATNAI